MLLAAAEAAKSSRSIPAGLSDDGAQRAKSPK
jgi:hypothetical protein